MRRTPRLNFLLAVLAVAALFGLLFSTLGRASQDDEKTLNIPRYPDEPLELVDVKIGQNSIKNDIKSKIKDSRGKSVLDHVKFKEKNDWARNVKIRLRNTSGRPIYGLSVSLFFEHSNPKIAFQIPLRRAETRDLKQQPLQPGDELNLEVADKEFNETMTMIGNYGLSPNELPVILSVDSALFSDDFGWFGGTLMKRDPNNRQKWDAVDKPAHPGASRLKQSAGFTLVSFRPSSFAPQGLQVCQQQRGGFFGYPCSDDGTCYRVEQLGAGPAGFLSDFPVPGKCKRHPEEQTEQDCAQNTTNLLLLFDFDCEEPSPTPTPEPTATSRACTYPRPMRTDAPASTNELPFVGMGGLSFL
jgi:hypothetical protein